MTPLARQIVKQLTIPIKNRTIDDRCGILKMMDDIHCFECSEIVPLVVELKSQVVECGVDARSTFLPAPKTWIEFSQPLSKLWPGNNAIMRHGYLLIECPENKGQAKVFTAHQIVGEQKIGACSWSDDESLTLDLHFRLSEDEKRDLREYRLTQVEDADYGEEWVDNWCGSEEALVAFLALINTPRIIGRKQHMPARTLEKKLLSSMGRVGRFPLHAWNEISLKVNHVIDRSSEPSKEAHLTGGKALHFCRSHLRIRLGRVEIVRGHWRGDPSLGIKQSRYKLVS